MIKNKCSGGGSCLIQTDTDEYIKDIDIECEYDCKPIKCPNFIICGMVLPLRYLQCHDGLCINCDIMFGTWQGGCGELKIKSDVECCICLETNIGVSYPKCDHYVCVKCFKRCFYGDEDEDNGENLKKCPLCRK
jgi:hypothetical protein